MFQRPAVMLPEADFRRAYQAYRAGNAPGDATDSAWVRRQISLRRRYMATRAKLAGLPDFHEVQDDREAIRALQRVLAGAREYAI